MRMLNSWAWIEGEELHFNIPKLLEVMGCADTPENREVATEAAAQVLRDLFPEIPHYVTKGAKRRAHA